MNRREVIAGLAFSVLVIGPVAALAQKQGKTFRVAYVMTAGRPEENEALRKHIFFVTLLGELATLGYSEGQNLSIEWHSIEGREERYPEVTAAVVRSKPDVILALSPTLLRHLKASGTAIPIVAYASDLLRSASVNSLARPGGNVTGISADAGLEIYGKYLEVLQTLRPGLTKVGFLANRERFDGFAGEALRSAAGRMGVSIIGPPIDGLITEGEYRRVLQAMKNIGADAVIVSEGPENTGQQGTIIKLIEERRLIAIYPFGNNVRAGGLVAYSIDTRDLNKRLARYLARVFEGTPPADLPIYQPSTFQLIFNLRAAKAIGLEVPPSLLARADEVIE